MTLLEAADEVARLSLFGHAPGCSAKSRASAHDDELDPDACNVCRAIEQYRELRKGEDGD